METDLTLNPNNKNTLLDKMWRLNNCYKIRTKDQGIITFKLNHIQKKIVEDIQGMDPIRHFTLKSRQVGLSTFWLLYWLDATLFQKGIVTGVLAHKLESIQHLMSIVKIAISNFPGSPIVMEEDSKTRVSFKALDSIILFSLEIRSSPLHNLHISEWCFCDNERIWATIGATNKWTNITGETTGNGIGNDGYLTYMDGKEGTNGYKTRFIPWYEHKEYSMPLIGQAELRPDKRERLSKLTQEQIHFRRQMMAKLKNSFFVEYPETEEDAFAQSGSNFFNNRKIVMLAKEAREYNKENPPIEETDMYTMWEKNDKYHRYCLGADVAEGIDGDYSTMKIMCLTCRQEAFSYRAHIGVDKFFRDIDYWGRKYNNCLVGVERNNHGHAILLGLDEIMRYPNLYTENAKETRILVTNKKKPVKKLGWHTTAISKTPMLDQYKIAIEGDSEEDENNFTPDFTIRDLTLLNECLTYQKDGIKLNAIAGKFDDMVMASSICYQMYLKLKGHYRGLEIVLSGGDRNYKT